MPKVIGIDLGTTNTCVAVVEGKPEVIANKGGYKTTPSMVAFTETGRRLVGHIAKRQAVTNAQHTITAAKRLIGRKWGSSEVQQARQTMSYRVVEGPHDDVRVELRGREYSIPELQAFVLQEMKQVAETHLGEPVERAVITVPAYFNDGQRQATKDAGRIAGLEVIRIINEPTAAALAYGFGKQFERKVAVFDLGGGTFDISILALAEGVFEVVATGGDSYLGGEDFDRRIVDSLAVGFRDKHNIDLRQDKMALQRLKEAAERAKCELSTVKEAEINLPFIISSADAQPLHLTHILTRDKFEALCADLVDRTIEISRQTMAQAKVRREDIEEVVLVGGMTRMPKVAKAVQDFFGREPSKSVHPDEVVAMGAAIQGASLVGEAGAQVLLLDVTSQSLGIMVAGGYYHKLIERNTTIPCSRSHIFTTVRDNQTSVKILVLQGESERAEQNELLGEFVLSGLRSAPKGVVEVDVSFAISADGIVSVTARDVETGRQQAITVSASSGLTEDEVERMSAESKQYLAAWQKEEEREVQRQELERLVQEVETLMPRVEHSAASSSMVQEAVRQARGLIARARDELERKGSGEGLTEVSTALGRTVERFQGVLRRVPAR